ncbi:MAG: glycoside hydrolase family 3 protein, partial [Microbacterium sp.]
VMVSTAVYERIDPSAPAAFSAPVVTGLLRGDLGFDGVVMTDDISNTAAVAAIPPGKRAVRAIRAGVDLLLLSADSRTFAPMYRAVLRTARNDPEFAAQVNAAARRILELKGRQADRDW